MSKIAITPAAMLEIQLAKWLKKGRLNNVVLHPTYGRSGLPFGEKFLADVIDKASRSILFAESGFLAPGHGFIRFAEVEKVFWMSKSNERFNPKTKSEMFDKLEIELSDDSTLLLQDLDQAVFPLLKFFRWLQRQKRL